MVIYSNIGNSFSGIEKNLKRAYSENSVENVNTNLV